MKIVNFGSLCVDNVYRVPYFVRRGETLPCEEYQIHAGGKGLNQSIAAAKAGAPILHAGCVGADGLWLRDVLEEAGVDTSLVEESDTPNGHAVIQVVPEGLNSIVIYGGANRTISASQIERTLEVADEGDMLLLQNEINMMTEIMVAAKARGMRIVFNAAPITDQVLTYPLDVVDYFIVNEVEAEAISGRSEPEEMLQAMAGQYPGAATILTLGENGAIYQDRDRRVVQAAFEAKATDTTAAGDCFIGFFLAEVLAGMAMATCLETACRAAAVCVTRPGAAPSIPSRNELAEL